MSILEPSSEDSGILNNLVRTSTSQKAFLGWTRDAVYRVAVNSAGRCFALELIASDRRTVSCELHGESGLFVIVEIGGLISWGQIDALVLLTDRFEAGGEIRSARLYDNGLRALLFFYSGRSLRSISDAASSPGVFQFIATGSRPPNWMSRQGSW